MTTELTTTQPSAVALIQHAIASGADPAYLRELLAVRREWEADEARKAYYDAISEFQRQAPIIEKGDKAHNKEYARLDRIWRTIRPLLTDLGLSVTWHITELRDGVCHVEGELAHRAGHSVRLTHDTPLPATITGQNAAQQMGSAETYSRRYALCSALGIVTGDDDDGHLAGSALVTDEQAAEVRAAIAALPAATRGDVQHSLLQWAGCESIETLPAKKFSGAMKAIRARAK